MQEYDMEDMRETDYKVEFNNIWKLWRKSKEQYHETLALLEICVAALERVETDAEGYCLWCYRCVALPMVDHSPGCLRKIALARAKGE